MRALLVWCIFNLKRCLEYCFSFLILSVENISKGGLCNFQSLAKLGQFSEQEINVLNVLNVNVIIHQK